MTHEHKTESQQPEPQRKSPAARDPLHGVTLETMLNRLVARYGWEELGDQIPIRCFLFEPSIKSSLAFLRRTQWARKKVEDWYAYDARRFPMEQHDASPSSDGEKPK
ncbi:MAG: VF530 family protein [Pirellulaceae bacterium]|nr:VF530 family protein [Pirellulaceae bacterium]